MSLTTGSIIYPNKLIYLSDLKKELMDIIEFVDSGKKELEKPIYHMDLPAVTYWGQNYDFKTLREKIHKFSGAMIRCERRLDAIKEVFNKLKEKFPNSFENAPEYSDRQAAITHFESDVAWLLKENQQNLRKVQDALLQIDDWLALKNRPDSWLTGRSSYFRW